MTGGVSLLFRGNDSAAPVRGRTLRASGPAKKASRAKWTDPNLQVELSPRTSQQIANGKVKLAELRREIKEIENEIMDAKQSRVSSEYQKLTKTLIDLRHFEHQWEKQLSLLQEELSAQRS